MRTEKVNKVIARLKKDPKHGESYNKDREGGLGFRNPVRDDTGEALHALVLANKSRRILEIGTAYGLSGMYLASGMDQFGRMLTIEFHPEVAKIAQANFDEAGLNVKVIQGDALEVIPTLAHMYDMVFLDAQKNQYLPYVELLRERGLIGTGSLIVADNVIDRADECQDFLGFIKQFEHALMEIGWDPEQKVPCGLLVARL